MTDHEFDERAFKHLVGHGNREPATRVSSRLAAWADRGEVTESQTRPGHWVMVPRAAR